MNNTELCKILSEQMLVLRNRELTTDEFKQEVDRAQAMAGLAQQVLKAQQNNLAAARLMKEQGYQIPMLNFLTENNENNG